jgi:5-methylcytosine-specific restriction endonuclease McrA
MGNNRTKINPNRRKAIFMRDKCQCVYCGQKRTLKQALCEYTLDHIVPVTLGGSGATENLITSCELCNKRKGRLTLKRFLKLNENEYNAGRSARHILRVIAHRTAKPLDRKYGNFRV